MASKLEKKEKINFINKVEYTLRDNANTIIMLALNTIIILALSIIILLRILQKHIG